LVGEGVGASLSAMFLVRILHVLVLYVFQWKRQVQACSLDFQHAPHVLFYHSLISCLCHEIIHGESLMETKHVI